MQHATSKYWFIGGCLAEIALLWVAVFLGWIFGRPAGATLAWNARDFIWGILSVLPMLILFWWMLRSTLNPLREIRDFLDEMVRPIMGSWSVEQLLVISILAGVCEESLFRGIIQGGLAPYLHPAGALLVASVLFGLCHAVNWAYAVIAALIGAYLGVLWMMTGNLLAPIIAHALYDFVALVYFLRVLPHSESEPPE